MIDWLVAIFTETDFLPHRVCIGGSVWLLSISVFSNILIFLSYFSIPVVLAYFLKNRKEQDFSFTLWLFAAFIFACGTTHLLHAITYWQPWYWLQAILDAFTAIVSVYTAIYLWPLLPQLLNLPSPKQLLELNRQLENDISERKRIENEMRHSRELLQIEITERAQVQDALVIANTRFNALFNAMRNGVAVYEAVDDGNDFVFRDFNHAAEILDNIQREQLLNKPVTQVFPDVERFGLLAVLRRVWRTGQPEHLPASLYQDGRLAVYRENYVYRLPSGEVVAVFEDLTERKKAEQAQQETAARLEKIASRLPGMVYQFRLNPDGSSCFPYASPTIQGIYGVSPEEVQENAAQVLAMLYPEDYQQVMTSISSSAQNLTSWQQEYRVQFADGTVRWLSGNALPQREGDGSTLWHGFITDITERKHKEIEYKTIIQASFSGFWCSDFSGRFLEVNTALCRMLGYTEQELLNMSIADIEVVENSADTAAHIQKIIQIGHDTFETRHRHKDGTIIEVEVNVLYEAVLGQRFFTFINDITERKRTENEILNTKNQLQATLNAIPDLMFEIDLDGVYHNFQAHRTDLLAAPPEQILGKNISEILPADASAICFSALQEALQQDWSTGKQIRLELPQGTHWFELSVAIKPTENEQQPHFIVLSMDITRRKQIEEALRNSEQKLTESKNFFQLLTQVSPVGIYQTDAQGLGIFANDKCCEMMGLSHQQLQGKGWAEALMSEDRDRVYNEWEAAIREYRQFSLEYRFQQPNGKIVWVYGLSAPIYDEQGAISGYIGTLVDITERKQVELALRDSEQKFRLLIEQIPLALGLTDDTGELLYINDRFKRTFGYTLEDIPTVEHWYLQAYPDQSYREQAIARWMTALEQAIMHNTDIEPDEYQITCKNGEVRVILISGMFFGNNLLATFADITERKRMEEQLRDNEAFTNSILNSLASHISVLDNHGTIIAVNNAWKQFADKNALPESYHYMLGASYFDVCQKAFDQADLEESSSVQYGIMAVLAGTRSTFEIEYPCHSPNEQHWFYMRVLPLKGSKPGVVISHENITQRRLVEEKLRESESHLRAVIENEPECIKIVDAKGRLKQMNSAGLGMIEADSLEQVKGGLVFNLIAPEYRKDYVNLHKRVIAGEVMQMEYEIIGLKGRRRWLETHAVPMQEHDQIVHLAVTRDITERKQAEQQLRELNRDFVTFLENTSDFIYFKDQNSRIRFCSQTLANITHHCNWRDLIGKHDFEIFPEETAQIYYQEELPVFTEGRPLINKVNPYYNENGSMGWVSTSKWPVFDFDNRKVIGIFGISRDITQLKKIEQSLQQSEFMLKEAQEIAHLGHWILDVPGNKLYWSDEIYRILGLQPQEFNETYEAFLEYVYPEDRSFVAKSYNSHLTNKNTYNIEHRILLKDGTVKYVSEKCKTEFAQDGHPLRSMGVMLDITERKELEKQLRNISLYTRNLIEVSLDPLMTISAEGKITDVNQATEKITGLAREQLINSDFAGYFTDPEQASVGYLEAFSKGYVTDYSLVIKHCDGYLTDVLFNAAVYKNESGEIAGVFAAARDISALKQIEAELKRSNSDLEQFAYSVSHDMRQPLRSVAGHLQLLSRSLKDKLDQDERENLNFALEGAKRMDAMILSLLEYSRVGRKTERKAWISSKEALEEALEFITPAMKEMNVEIHITGDWGQVFASHDELSRLFMNLISNAIKYREPQQPRQIEIDSMLTQELWSVRVRDYGIGINPQQIDRLFQFFSRLQSRARFEGTGMGLALCRRIVEHHGGRIWVESEGEGQGSCFRFELPIPEQTGVTLPAENGV